MCDPEFRADARRPRLHPRRRHRRDHPARAVRRRVQRPRRPRSPGTSTGTKPQWRGEPPRAGARPGAAAGLGPPRLGRGPTRQGRARGRHRARRSGGVEELRELGFTPPTDGRRASGHGRSGGSTGTRVADLVADPARRPAVELERRRHPRRGRADRRRASTSSPPHAVRRELVEDLTSRAVDAVRAAAGPRRRARTRPRAHLTTGARRRGRPRHPARRASRARRDARCRVGARRRRTTGSTMPSSAVVAALAGDGRLLVIEGAAGAGKTTDPGRRPRPARDAATGGWWWSPPP